MCFCSCWFSNPPKKKEFGVESRNEVLCALGKTSRIGLQIVRYFQELILWAQFLYLLISEKQQNPSWWYLLLVTSRNLLQKKICVWLNILPLHQNHIYTDLPLYVFEPVSQSYRKCCLLGHSPHFTPNKTTHNSHLVHFFLSQWFFIWFCCHQGQGIKCVFAANECVWCDNKSFKRNTELSRIQ